MSEDVGIPRHATTGSLADEDAVRMTPTRLSR